MTDKKDEAILLDRDGTIIVDKGYVYKIKDLEFLPNSIKGMRKMQDAGYKLIIASNQSGIARGFYTEEDYFAFRDEMHKKLKEQGVIISAEYFCPHHSEKGIGKYKTYCNCRKPQAGMLEQAAKDFNLNLRKCWMIGDSERDIVAGIIAGCNTVHVLTGEEKNFIISADFRAKDLLEAAGYILNDKNK